jgi:hypothetical protein
VIFGGAAGAEKSRSAVAFRARLLAELTLSTQSEIPSLRSGQVLRFAQDDSEGLGMTPSRQPGGFNEIFRKSLCLLYAQSGTL